MKEIFHKRKLLKCTEKILEILEIKFLKRLERFMFTCGYTLHRLGTKPGFFLIRSMFLPAHATLWPERSGATT